MQYSKRNLGDFITIATLVVVIVLMVISVNTYRNWDGEPDAMPEPEGLVKYPFTDERAGD